MTNVHGRTVQAGRSPPRCGAIKERIAPLRRHDCPEVVVSDFPGQELGDDDSLLLEPVLVEQHAPTHVTTSVDLDRSGGTTFGGGHPAAADFPADVSAVDGRPAWTGWRPRGLADRLMGVVGAVHG